MSQFMCDNDRNILFVTGTAWLWIEQKKILSKRH